MPNKTANFLEVLEPISSYMEEKNGWMPCPRCGRETEEPPVGTLAGKRIRAIVIVFWLVWIIFVPVIMFSMFSLVTIVVITFSLVMLTALLVTSVLIGMTYRCESCNLTWTYEEMEWYHDQ